jgi:hypothetical protein
MKLILVAFFFIGLIAILPSETEANVIAGKMVGLSNF